MAQIEPLRDACRPNTMDSSSLPITGPCPIDLDAIGFDRTSKRSHCTHCDKNVQNLSNMTEREARAFLREHAGQRLCVSYARDRDGAVAFKPEPTIVPLTRLRRRPAAAAAGLGLALALAACTPHGDTNPQVDGTEEPCKPSTDRGIEVLAGEAPIEPVPMAGAMMVEPPEPPEPPEIEQVEGEIELHIPDEPPEPQTRGRVRLPDHG